MERNWKDVGKVYRVNIYGSVKGEYPSLDYAIRALKHVNLNDLQNKNLERFVWRKSIPWLACKNFDMVNYNILGHRPYYSGGWEDFLIDDYDMIIPAGVIAAHAASIEKEIKVSRWRRNDYDPEKDFRNGPLKGRAWHRGRCGHSGHTYELPRPKGRGFLDRN